MNAGISERSNLVTNLTYGDHKYDFNSDTYLVPYNEVSDRISDDFPNLTHTALPLKVVKARYLIHMDSVDKAKIMLYKALKLHPDHMAARQMLGSLFLKEKKYAQRSNP